MESRYQPIENYGVIGNLRTVDALWQAIANALPRFSASYEGIWVTP